MKRFFCLFLLCVLAACARNAEVEAPPAPVAPQCETAYVVLPDNFVIDLAAGSEVILNPARQQFALFCEAKDARDALRADMASGRLDSSGKWRVYILDGEFAHLATPCGDGQFCLAGAAMLKDWVE